MKKPNKLVPELRFPEFENEGGWDEKSFEELFEIGNGRDYKHLNKGNIPVYGSGGYMLSVDDYIYDGESVCIGRKGTIDKPMFLNDKFWTVDTLFYTHSFNDCLPKYIYYIFQNIDWLKHNEAGGVPSLSKTNIQKIKILIPQPEEQQKIASCLSSLDDLIAAHSDKLQALKDHKKGLMQNLFPQEGETVPKYRFPEFEDDGEWVFEEFDKVYSFLVTNSFSRENLNYKGGKVKNIHYGDIHTKFKTLFDITKEKVPYINPEIFIDRIREECYCKDGDLIFADASEDLNDVGKSIEIVYLNNEKLLSGLHTLLARQTDSQLVVGFAGHLFLTEKIRNQIKKEAQGAKVLGISGTRLSNIIIYYPINKKEQKKIVSCLSVLDELITAQAEKIEQLQLHKKGLMQGLFPKVD